MKEKIKITQKDLENASENGLIDKEKVTDLFQYLSLQSSISDGKESSKFALLLYYLGGFIAILSVSLFMKLTFDVFGKEGLLVFSIALFMFTLFLEKQFNNKGYERAAGIMVSLSLVLVPMIVFILQHMFGFYNSSLGNNYSDYHHLISGKWIFIELVTLLVGSLLLYKYKYPFVVFPVAITLWYLSMDLIVLMLGNEYWSFELRRQMSMFFGIFMIILAIYVDYRSSRTKDFSYWLYMVGATCFWLGLSLNHSDSEIMKFIYFSINVLLLLLGSILLRTIFIVFGSIGVFIYFAHLAQLFEGIFGFMLLSVFFGIALIYAGIWWNRNGHLINKKLLSKFSSSIQKQIREIHK